MMRVSEMTICYGRDMTFQKNSYDSDMTLFMILVNDMTFVHDLS